VGRLLNKPDPPQEDSSLHDQLVPDVMADPETNVDDVIHAATAVNANSENRKRKAKAR